VKIVIHMYYSRVNEGFYFLILKNRSDFDDFFFAEQLSSIIRSTEFRADLKFD
jgi:hypothetical protein